LRVLRGFGLHPDEGRAPRIYEERLIKSDLNS